MTSRFIERVMKDPKKRERFFLLMTFGPIVANVLIFVGFLLFILRLF